jgi:hypothetical protein
MVGSSVKPDASGARLFAISEAYRFVRIDVRTRTDNLTGCYRTPTLGNFAASYGTVRRRLFASIDENSSAMGMSATSKVKPDNCSEVPEQNAIAPLALPPSLSSNLSIPIKVEARLLCL